MEALACVLHAEKDLRLETVLVAEMHEGQVLVRIGACGICGSDLHYSMTAPCACRTAKAPSAN